MKIRQYYINREKGRFRYYEIDRQGLDLKYSFDASKPAPVKKLGLELDLNYYDTGDKKIAFDKACGKAKALDGKIRKQGYEPAEYADLLKEYCDIDYLRAMKDNEVEKTITIHDNRNHYM